MYCFDTRIRYSETDEKERLTPIGILDYFQDVSTFHSEDIGQGGVPMLKKGYAWVLCSWQVDILRYPMFAERVTVGTIPYEFRGFTGCRNCFIRSSSGELLVRANSIWAFMDMNAGRPIKVPEFVSTAYGIEGRLEMEYKPRRIILPDEGGEVLEPIIAGEENLDLLGHVNNGQFARIALGCRSRRDYPGKLRVEYKTQAHAGDVLVPVRYNLKDKEIICLKRADDGIYATLELEDFSEETE